MADIQSSTMVDEVAKTHGQYLRNKYVASGHFKEERDELMKIKMDNEYEVMKKNEHKNPQEEEAEEEIAPPGIPVPSNAIQIIAQILGSPGCATVEQRSSTKKAEVDKGSHPQTPLTPQAPDEETRATMSDPAAIQQASKKKRRD